MNKEFKQFLLLIGFKEINKTEYNEYDTHYYYELEYSIGVSRRGQYYYLLINAIGDIRLYASDPDGSGGPTDLTEECMETISQIYKYKIENS